MLNEFVKDNRDEIIARCHARVAKRISPRATQVELDQGITMFLRELEQTLQTEVVGPNLVTSDAVSHGGALLRSGFTIAQVVHNYGDACQTITELAIERQAAITVAEFRGLNRCLDNAIADAVTEYERLHELDVVAGDVRRANEHLGFLAHELRNLIGTAMLAFDALRAGLVGMRGSTGDVLGRSLTELRTLLDRSLAEVRLTAGITRLEHVPVARFVEELEVSAILAANAHHVKLTVNEVDPDLVVYADRQILGSIIFNLLQNAFKYTVAHGHVWLRVYGSGDRVLFDVEDQCGGLPTGKAEQLFKPFEQQGTDRTGIGLGLAICARGVMAHHGEIRVRNQNRGCVFTVDLLRAPRES
jgi:signal transduction histidine kinase